MARIKGVGAPTRTTKGSVGDTYIDLKSKKQYRCIYAYHSTSGTVEYTWRVQEDEVSEEDTPSNPMDVVAKNNIPESSKDDIVDEVINEDEPVSEETTPDVEDETPAKSRKPKYNYNKQYNKH